MTLLQIEKASQIVRRESRRPRVQACIRRSEVCGRRLAPGGGLLRMAYTGAAPRRRPGAAARAVRPRRGLPLGENGAGRAERPCSAGTSSFPAWPPRYLPAVHTEAADTGWNVKFSRMAAPLSAGCSYGSGRYRLERQVFPHGRPASHAARLPAAQGRIRRRDGVQDRGWGRGGTAMRLLDRQQGGRAAGPRYRQKSSSGPTAPGGCTAWALGQGGLSRRRSGSAAP